MKLICNSFLPANVEFSRTFRITRTLIQAHCTLDTTFTPSACISCSLRIASLSHQRYLSTTLLNMTKLWCKKKQQAQQEELAFELKLPGSSVCAQPLRHFQIWIWGCVRREEESCSFRHSRKSASPTSVAYPWFLNSCYRARHMVGTQIFAENERNE